ncbi:MAG TPA: putative Ig domain-containing protein [Longimicrobium sp.]|nr:putative Ig domain-containing protein [Longimicrobium sp.]
MSRAFFRRAAAAAAVLATFLAAARAQAQTTVTGRLSLVYEVREQSQANATLRYFLVDDRGAGREVELSAEAARPFGGPRGLDRRRVAVTLAAAVTAPGGRPAPARVLSVTPLGPPEGPRLSASGDPSGAVQNGPRPYVTVLCRFPDQPQLPHPADWYANLLTGTAQPGLDHYWREVSDGRINLGGSAVVGWYDLPSPLAAYFPNGMSQSPDFGKLVNDCTGVADAAVDFTQYVGVNMQFNANLPASWGGSWTLTRDRTSPISSPMTWMASWAGQSVYAHEMGHSFGLPHSSGPYTQTYDSKWDVMSHTYTRFDAAYGSYIGQHTIIWHKELLGWVPAARTYTPGTGVRRSFVLERSELPPANANPTMVRVPIPGGSQFFTVEARRFVGYDQFLPGEAVLVHRVNPLLGDRDAQVVDPDGNGDPNDTGAMWLPGETFTDPQTGFTLRVDSITATGFGVTVATGATLQLSMTGPGTVSGTGPFGAPCTESCIRVLPYGTTVTLSAQPAAGKAFSGWSGDCTGSTCTLAMQGDRAVSVAFGDTLAITSAAARAGAVVGQPHADTLRATGGAGTPVWSVAAPAALPPGIALTAGGVLAGTPTQAGTFTFTAAVNAGGFKASRAFTVSVVDSVVVLSSAQRPGAIAAVAYADTLAASGGNGSYQWSLAGGALPAGMSLSPGGVLAGTPAAVGDYAFTVRVSSGPAATTRALALAVAPLLQIASDSSRRAGVMGAEYRDTLVATGPAGAGWRLTGGTLPDGVALDSVSGVLSGVATKAGTFRFTARAAVAGQSASRVFVVQVTQPTLAPAAVLDQLLGAKPLSTDEARFLDLLGNRNGRVDVGDVRAWLVANQHINPDLIPGLRELLNSGGPASSVPNPQVKP